MRLYYETSFPTLHVQRDELASLPIRTIDFADPADVARLYRLGFDIERTARGEPTVVTDERSSPIRIVEVELTQSDDQLQPNDNQGVDENAQDQA
jgi:hypothetical protein